MHEYRTGVLVLTNQNSTSGSTLSRSVNGRRWLNFVCSKNMSISHDCDLRGWNFGLEWNEILWYPHMNFFNMKMFVYDPTMPQSMSNEIASWLGKHAIYGTLVHQINIIRFVCSWLTNPLRCCVQSCTYDGRKYGDKTCMIVDFPEKNLEEINRLSYNLPPLYQYRSFRLGTRVFKLYGVLSQRKCHTQYVERCTF